MTTGAQSSSEPPLPDVVVVAMEAWDEVWRRMQPLADGWARRDSRRRVLFVALPVDVSNLARTRRFGELWRSLRGSRLWSPADAPANLHVLRAIKLLPNTLAAGRRVNHAVERRQIRKAMRTLGIDAPILWMNPYYAAHLPGHLGERLSVYDVGDDWTAFKQGTPAELGRVVADDLALTRTADATVVVSASLRDLKQNVARRLFLVPNGVHLDRYAPVARGEVAADPIARDWPRPVLGYTGSLHGDRFDVDLLRRLATALPQATVALVGPNMLGDEDKATLAALPNVRTPGPVPFARMPAVLAGFDVCIVPHVVSPFTNSLSPLKLYEYLAAGRPIVSVPVSGFADHPQVVRLGTGDAFVEAVKDALREPADPNRAAAATKLSLENAWDSRLDDLDEIVRDVLRETSLESPAPKLDCGRPAVSVAIVSYNTRDLTLRCLRGLYAEIKRFGEPCEVLLFDNASADASAAAVREAFPQVQVIQSDENAGFGRANNAMIARASGEFVLLLNTDAFLHEGALVELAAALRDGPQLGAAGPRLLNEDGSLQQSCFRFPGPGEAWRENLWVNAVLKNHPRLGDLRYWPHDAPRDVDFVTGACVLVRRRALEQAGGFDENFFMYSEETDLEKRIRRAGWGVRFVPSAVVTHLGGGSGKLEKARVNRSFFDSLDYFTAKHHGRLGLVSMRLATAAGCALRLPAWMAAWSLATIRRDPNRRAVAASKLRMRSWLLRRQLTAWPRTRRPPREAKFAAL